MTTSISETKIIRKCLSKTEYSDTRISSADASELTSLVSGSVLLQLVLNADIKDGIYSKCNPDAYFTDFLLFAINPADKYITAPGIYAALTPDGIELTIWTKKGRYSITDTTTSISAGNMSTIEFAWDGSGTELGTDATMSIFIDGSSTAAANYPISEDSLTDIEFSALDDEFMQYGLEADICDFVVVNGIIPRLKQRVLALTKRYMGNNFLLLAGRDGSMIYPDLLERPSFFEPDLSCLGDSRYCADVSDSDQSVYFASYDGSDIDTGSVIRYRDGEIIARLDGLRNPRAVSVQQADGIDYPRLTTHPERSCTGVWIADEEKVIYTDPSLNVVAEITGFSSPQCIRSLGDGRAWVCDTGNNRVVLVAENATSILDTENIMAPTFGMATVLNEFYAFDSDDSILVKYLDTERVAELGLAGPTGIDINPNTGDIVVGYGTGFVRTYNRNFTPISTNLIHGNVSSVMVKRGYLRDSFYWVDFDYRRIGRNLISETLSRYEDESIGNMLFNGGMAGPAHNLATSTAEFQVGSDTIGDFDSIYSLDAPQYKVDQLNVDLSGGRGNEQSAREFGDFSDGTPTDLRKGTIKTTRLPE